MSELEDKINNILSSPAEMEKIMGIARSLSGSLGGSPQGEGTALAAQPAPHLAGITSTLKEIDPIIFRLATRLVNEYTTGKNDTVALLNTVKPYLKEDQREIINRATEIAKLARGVLREFSGGEKAV